MRNLVVFILVALFALGGLMLVGCKKKEAAPTAETGTVMPETVEAPPETPATPATAATGVEAPAEEGAPGEGGM
jgi:hypothetical protein